MATEHKSVRVVPEREDWTIRAFQAFGWRFTGSQEIYNKDSHLDRGYSVTVMTHYVKLNFERDSATVKNYQKLRDLENLYYSNAEPKKPRTPSRGIFIFLYVVFSLPPLIALLLGDFTLALSEVAIGLVPTILVHRHMNKKMSNWKKAYDKCWDRRNKILQQAERLQ